MPEIHHPQRHNGKGVFQIQPPVSSIDFSNNISIPDQTDLVKYLGIHIDKNLTWKHHKN